jgi:hypothetical protein
MDIVSANNCILKFATSIQFLSVVGLVYTRIATLLQAFYNVKIVFISFWEEQQGRLS